MRLQKNIHSGSGMNNYIYLYTDFTIRYSACVEKADSEQENMFKRLKPVFKNVTAATLIPVDT